MRAARQDRRPGRRQRGAAGGAARARRRRAGAAARLPGRARSKAGRAREVERFSELGFDCRAAATAGAAAGAGLPGALPARAAGPTRIPAGRTGRTTRCASACCRASRRCSAAAPPLDWRPTSSTATTGRPRSRRSTCARATPRGLLTIHNLAFQGNFERAWLDAARPPARSYFSMDELEFHGRLSFLKGGLVLRRRASPR